MTLRVRLLATSLLVALPLAFVLFIVDDKLRFADMSDRLDQFTRAEIASGVQDRCLSNDGVFDPQPPRPPRPPRENGFEPPPPPPQGRRGGSGPEGRPYELASYSSDFSPARVSLPPISDALRAALAGSDAATVAYKDSTGRGIERGVWLDRNASSCAILVVRMRERPGARRDQLAALALITLSSIVAAWIAAGPVISRLRKLAAAVHVSADSRYETPVPSGGGDEVAALAEAFNDAGARVRKHLMELQAREETLRKFVANTAHDIGVPLTVIQGHLASLEPNDAVRAAINEVHYLGSLIRNLNAATRLDAADIPIERHPVDLNALVERVVARHRMIAAASQIELNFAVPEKPIVVSADVTLLEQALSNLVDNAIRYGHAGGHAAIVLDATGQGFTLAVVDDGPGVSDAEIARMMEPRFRSAEARTRRPDGQGLGLAIAAEAIERLDLTLTLTRNAPAGLRAEIRSRASRPTASTSSPAV
jgi:signal transduction histidine kinase